MHEDALRIARRGTANADERHELARAIERQIPHAALSIAVAEHGAKTVISVVVPGGGATGVKSLNEELIGYTLTSKLLAGRAKIFREAFANHGLTMVSDTYKTATVVSDRPPAELGTQIHDSLVEIDRAMREQLRTVLQEGLAYWRVRREGSPADSKDHAAAHKRMTNMEAMLHKLEGDPTFTFGLTVGAAELAGGKAATYEQVLAAEMSATRAAIMARDPVLARSAGTALGDPRALIYSPDRFEAFARDTIVLRDKLKTKTLPWHGERRVVVDEGGSLDRDLVWAARKNKFDPATLVKTEGADDVATLRELNRYMTRVNALDYVSHELGSDIVKTSKQVSDAVGLIKALESKQPLGKATYEQVAGVVRGRGAQAGTASESRFYERAAGRKDRTVLNADIKELGIDVIDGNARAMKKVAHGGDIDAVARGASDEIVKMKRKFVSNLEAYYRSELLPAVKQRAQARGRDVSRLLQVEAEPLLLLGGDEITISLPREFEEFGVVPALVAHLQKHARSRVAVTRTGATLDGARGHEQAMKASEAGHDVLKKYEELAAHVRDVTKRRPGGQRDSDREIVEYFQGLYTSTDLQGKTVIHRQDGSVASDLAEKEAQAAVLKKEGDR